MKATSEEVATEKAAVGKGGTEKLAAENALGKAAAERAAADAKDSGPVPAGYKKGTGSKLSRSPKRVYCSRRARPSSRTRLPSRATETLLLRRRNWNAWSCE